MAGERKPSVPGSRATPETEEMSGDAYVYDPWNEPDEIKHTVYAGATQIHPAEFIRYGVLPEICVSEELKFSAYSFHEN